MTHEPAPETEPIPDRPQPGLYYGHGLPYAPLDDYPGAVANGERRASARASCMLP